MNDPGENTQNSADQRDEVDALRAIYGDKFKVISEEFRQEIKGNDPQSRTLSDYNWVYDIDLSALLENQSAIHSGSIVLRVSLPQSYPSRVLPVCNLSGHDISQESAAFLIRELASEFGLDREKNHLGQVVVFEYVQWLLEMLNKTKAENDIKKYVSVSNDLENRGKKQTTFAANPIIKSEDQTSKKNQRCDCCSNGTKFTLLSTELLLDRKSRFQGHIIYPVVDYIDLDNAFEYLSTNARKVDVATHNIRAWRFEKECEKKGRMLREEAYNDDGEKEAGKRMLYVMQQCDIMNCIVFVSRWYGGIQLGPDRFKHIMVQTRAAIDLKTVPKIATAEKGGKKKGKKKK